MNLQPGQTPLDYLNQIAPEQHKASPFKWNLKTIILAAVAILILVIIIAVVVNAIVNSRKTPWEQLSARLAVTTTVVNNSSSLIKNSQLRSLNSGLKLYLTNTTRDIQTPLTNIGVDPKKIPDSITKAENSTGMTERLEDARLNAKYDSTYAREMSYQLSTILALYQKLIPASTPQTKTILQTAQTNLEPIQQELANFNASTE
jgi:hypothetical protein